MLVLLGNSLAPTLREYFKARVCDEDRPITLLPASIGKFVSTEAFSEIKSTPENLKGQPVTIVQSLAATGDHTANDLAMQLLLTVRTLKRNGAGPVWVVMPFAAYGRQDKVSPGRMTSVAMDDFMFLLKESGAQGVSTLEVHSPATIEFMTKNFGKENCYVLDSTDLFVSDLSYMARQKKDIVVGGPDSGAHDRADAVAASLNADEFGFEKQHIGVNETEVTGFDGDVKDKRAVTIDDMIDTGGTIENSQVTLAGRGAVERHVYAAHGIFSKGGLERLFTAKTADGNEYAITKLVVTDSIDIEEKLTALRRQYGDVEVNSRVRQIGTGWLLHDHITRDIATHPAMKAEL